MIWNEFPCLDFIDSKFNDHTGSGRVFDRLPLTEWQRGFLTHWGWSTRVPASRQELATLRELRSRLRHLLEDASQGKGIMRAQVNYLGTVLASAPMIYGITRELRVTVLPIQPDWRWVAAELTRSAIELVTSSDLGRIKVCANPDCSWLFFDESFNRSRRWCQANICGNLIAVRQHRTQRGRSR
jgi:predicted RNA-binding Zn ribbon-like protein